MGAILCERGAVLLRQQAGGSPVWSPAPKVESSVARGVADSESRGCTTHVATSSYLERLESGT